MSLLKNALKFWIVNYIPVHFKDVFLCPLDSFQLWSEPLIFRGGKDPKKH